MEQCLIDNKICSIQNQKCKVCKLDDCKKTLLMLEEKEAMIAKTKEERLIEELKKEYPECVGCSYLHILSLEKKKVYCPYMINGCVLQNRGEKV